MRELFTIARLEWRLQIRSGRFRFAVLAYLLLSSLPSLMLFFLVRKVSFQLLTDSAYLANTSSLQPFLVAGLAILVVGGRSGGAALREQWGALSSAPLSNAGFLVRRWLVLLSLLVPITALPYGIAAVFAHLAEQPVHDPVTWFWAWALQSLPRLVVMSAGWLALVTVMGSELMAWLAGVLGLELFVTLLNQILLKFRLRLTSPMEWFGMEDAAYWLQWAQYYQSERARSYHPGFAATSAPIDPWEAGQMFLSRGLLVSGLALFALAVGAAFLGRTRRDLKPWHIPADHSLRTYLKMANDLRAKHAPGAALGRPDKAFVLLAAVVACLTLGGSLKLREDWRLLAHERFEAARHHAYEPIPSEVRPQRWKIQGEILGDGRLWLEVDGGLQHGGDAPLGELVFTLNPGLAVDSVEADGRTLSSVQVWDRLRLTVDPPLQPGEDLELRWRIRGFPTHRNFGLRSERHRISFVQNYQRSLSARFPRELKDLSRGQIERAIGPRRIDLRPGDLGPVPRYTTWQLTPPKQEPTKFGEEVPPEILHQPAWVDLDLRSPSPWKLADSCGHSSRLDGGEQLLQGECEMPLSKLMVRGGPMEEVSDPSSALTLFVLPAHRELGNGLLHSLQAAARLSDRAWPGGEGLQRLVVLEWPPPFSMDLTAGIRPNWYETVDLHLDGKLLSVPEGKLIDQEPLAGEVLVARSLVQELLQRRDLEPEEIHVFRDLFRGLMVRRMGKSSKGATLGGQPWLKNTLSFPILRASIYQKEVFELRLPAVMVEVESRVGSQSLFEGIETFLARESEEPGTVRELFDDLQAASGVSLERMFEDYFLGKALPMLELRAVKSSRLEGGRYRVEGRLQNLGSGESICPVILKTEIGESVQKVTVDTEASTKFEFVTSNRPLRVLLDPRKTCFRFLKKNWEVHERIFLAETEG